MDVTIKNNKLKQCVDLVFRSKLNKSDGSESDSSYNNLYGLVETGSDCSDLM